MAGLAKSTLESADSNGHTESSKLLQDVDGKRSASSIGVGLTDTAPSAKRRAAEAVAVKVTHAGDTRRLTLQLDVRHAHIMELLATTFFGGAYKGLPK